MSNIPRDIPRHHDVKVNPQHAEGVCCRVTQPGDGPISTSACAPEPAVAPGLDFIVCLEGRGRRAALEEAVREAIRDGRLRAGDLLPSSRSLARDLNVSRGTVVEAYEQLAAEGWLVPRHGRGTSVAELPTPIGPRAENPQVSVPRYDLRPGHADPSSFPRRDWAAAMRKVLVEAPDEAFGYPDPRGRPELRSALAGYLGRARGVRTDPENLIVCSGAGHGIGLALRALMAVGAKQLAVEDPSSPQLREIAVATGIRAIRLPCDGLGARTDLLPDLGADVTVVTPAHQYPLGATLDSRRRTELIAWTRSGAGVVIEDDYDGELRYDRQPIGAVQALDPGSVVYVGTTSKSLSAALRIGWLAVPAGLLGPTVSTLRWVNATPSVLVQLALARFIESGQFDRHIRRMRGIYRQRRDLLVSTLSASAPQLRVGGIAAGGHVLVRLPVGGPSERDLIAGAARFDLALAGLGDYRFLSSEEGRDCAVSCHGGQRETGEYSPALVIGYGTPAGRSYRGAVAALGDYLRNVYQCQ
jgi:GntR family transcriptional regulator / MocR family aminotransferase